MTQLETNAVGKANSCENRGGFELTCLKITRPSASYLLAMKCLACRTGLPGYPGDIEDIRFLIKKMDIRDLEQIEEHIARFYPFEALTTAARGIIEKLLSRA